MQDFAGPSTVRFYYQNGLVMSNDYKWLGWFGVVSIFGNLHMSYQSIVWIQNRYWLLHLVYWYYHGILHCFDLSYCLYGQIILPIYGHIISGHIVYMDISYCLYGHIILSIWTDHIVYMDRSYCLLYTLYLFITMNCVNKIASTVQKFWWWLEEVHLWNQGDLDLPSGKLTVCYWKWPIYSGFTHWKWWIFP